MAETKPYHQVIEDKIQKVKTRFLRTVLSVCAKNKAYPKDCLVDGSLDKMIDEIIKLEEASGCKQES